MPGDQPEAGDGASDPGRAAHAPLEPAHRPGALARPGRCHAPSSGGADRRPRGLARSRSGSACCRRRRRSRPGSAGAPRDPRASASSRKSERCESSHSRSPKLERKAAIWSAGSPLAVGSRQSFGRGPGRSPSRWSRIASLPRRRENSCPPSARIERSASGTRSGSGTDSSIAYAGARTAARRISGTASVVSPDSASRAAWSPRAAGGVPPGTRARWAARPPPARGRRR